MEMAAAVEDEVRKCAAFACLKGMKGGDETSRHFLFPISFSRFRIPSVFLDGTLGRDRGDDGLGESRSDSLSPEPTVESRSIHMLKGIFSDVCQPQDRLLLFIKVVP